jgi:hypothetical protein
MHDSDARKSAGIDCRLSPAVKSLRPLLLDQLPEDWDLGAGPGYRRKQVAEWIFKSAPLPSPK